MNRAKNLRLAMRQAEMKRAQTEARYAEMHAVLARAVNAENEAKEALAESRNALAQARKDIDDLKARLKAAGDQNAEMRGYIARVQEDDVVREELVQTGHPEAPQLEPKRKPHRFIAPNDRSMGAEDESGFVTFGGMRDRDRPRPRPWVTY